MNRNRKKQIIFVLSILLVINLGFLIYFMGLIDYIPRLRASAKSPNGEIIVQIYQKRLFPRPFFPRMGAVAKVYDRNGNLIYDKIIHQDDDYDDTVGGAYKEISFSDDEIRIGPGAYIPDKPFVIKKSDLK